MPLKLFSALIYKQMSHFESERFTIIYFFPDELVGQKEIS